MSFLKITDPIKRDFIVEDFLKTKKNIKHSYLAEKLGDIGLQRELTKLYKPITDNQSAISKEIKESSIALKALPSSISSSLKAIQFPQYPSIEVYEDPVEDVRTLELGQIASEYLQKYTSNKKSTDTTFGIYSKNGNFYIGDSPISIQNDDITIRDKTYAGSPGLWELITMAKPDKSIYDANDMDNYAEILYTTNAMKQPKNPSKPKSNRSEKYKEIIKPIWLRSTGEGIPTIVIPQDPNALTEMLNVRIASFKAGNTGVRNEIVSICDELLRQGMINKEAYKSLMLHLR
jgi:hypothetical protein